MRHLLAPATLFLSLTSSAIAQTNVEESALQYVPRSQSNFVFIGDVLPVVRRVLKSKKLVEFLELPTFKGNENVNPRLMRARIDGVEGMIPSSIVVAVSDEGFQAVGRALRAITALYLVLGLIEGDEAEFQKRLPELQAEVLPLFDALSKFGHTIFVGTRHGSVAAGWFRQLVASAKQQQAADSPLILKIENDVMTARMQLAKALPPELVTSFLAESAFSFGADDPFIAKVNAAIAGIEVQARLELLDEGLLFSFGASEGAKIDQSALGKLWSAAKPPLMFARWDAGSMRAGIDKALAMWRRWEKTAAGKAARAQDEDDFLGSLEDLGSWFQRVPLAGTMRVVADDGVSISILENVVPADELSTGIGKLVPAAGLVMMNGTASWAETIGQFLRNFEDRLALQAFRSELGDSTARGDRAQKASEVYYKRLGNTRTAILRTSLSYFDKGFALIGTARGKAKILPGLDAKRGPFGVPEFAMVGKLARGKSGQEYVARLIGAMFRDAGVPVPESIEGYRKDLGLGVPTLIVPYPVPNTPIAGAMALAEDLVPHALEVEGYLVFSSSIRLSKEILAASKGEAPRQPVATQNGKTVAAFHLTGELMATWVQQAVEASKALDPRGERPPDFEAALDAVDHFTRLLDSIESRSVISGNRMRTEVRVKF